MLQFFKGNKRITVSGGGQWQEDMDIKFYFIVGTPPRDVLEMQQIWRPQSKSYTSIMNDDCFEPRSHKMLSSASAFKINTVVTGHGQQGEFIPRNHYIDVDNNPSNKNTWRVWTECVETLYTHKGVLGFMIEPDGAWASFLMLMNLT